MTYKRNAAVRAQSQLERQLRSMIILPTVDCTQIEPVDLANVMRDLERLHALTDDLGSTRPYLDHDGGGVGFDTPLGVVIGAVGEWCCAQKARIYTELDAMRPEGWLAQEERLVALLTRELEGGEQDAFLARVEEWKAHRAARSA